MAMKSKHRKTLMSIFETPVRSNILWNDIESLLAACNAEISEGLCSRVRVALSNVRAVFHIVHTPEKKQIEAQELRCAVF